MAARAVFCGRRKSLRPSKQCARRVTGNVIQTCAAMTHARAMRAASPRAPQRPLHSLWRGLATSVRLARRYKRAPSRSAALHSNSPHTGTPPFGPVACARGTTSVLCIARMTTIAAVMRIDARRNVVVEARRSRSPSASFKDKGAPDMREQARAPMLLNKGGASTATKETPNTKHQPPKPRAR